MIGLLFVLCVLLFPVGFSCCLFSVVLILCST